MSTPSRICTKIHDTKVLVPRKTFGPSSNDFGISLTTGFALYLTLEVHAIDASTTVTVNTSNRLSENGISVVRSILVLSAIGTKSGQVFELHQMVDFNIVIAGGNAEIAFGFTVVDDAFRLPVVSPITGRFIESPLNAGSRSMLVNGSPGSPLDFIVLPSATQEKFLTGIRLVGQGNGIKFGQFLSKNQPLTNGIALTIRSNNNETAFPLFNTTEDIMNDFAFGSDNFTLFIQAGGDQMRATLTFRVPFQLFKQGTFVQDDFIRFRIQDDLTAGLSDLHSLVAGNERDF